MEVDSMSAADSTNTQTGVVQATPAYNASTRKAIIPIEELEEPFRKEDQHRVGRIDIAGYGSFVTIKTRLVGGGVDRVEIRNAPSTIVNAAGAAYTLWDDDAGSAGTFTMAGFDAPPVYLPKVPDTAWMSQAYNKAYLDPIVDTSAYDANSPFKPNTNSDDEARDAANANKDLLSTSDYWAVHVTSAFQYKNDKDNDPDTEETAAGLTFGVVIVDEYFLWPDLTSGALVFLETIRDQTRGNLTAMRNLERYTVVHETGHEFFLVHADGHYPPGDEDDPAEDYIMTDVLGQNTMAPNKEFSAKSLRKIRSIDHPQPAN